MASVRVRKDTGLLLIDFSFNGVRCREHTMLPDTPANRARLLKVANAIDRAIQRGSFVYGDFFPNSRNVARDWLTDNVRAPMQPRMTAHYPETTSKGGSSLPLFSEFAHLWLEESAPRWRERHQLAVTQAVNNLIAPFFDGKRIDEITRADVLAFRAHIAKRPGRAGKSLNNKSINKRMTQLKAILNEACQRCGLPSPARGIKSLKQARSVVMPLTLAEVESIRTTIRADYQPYITVRCLTGLRTGEANGLQWCDIDFEQNLFRVERVWSRTGISEPKTDSSRREISMVPQVRAAFEAQLAHRIEGCPWVFHSPLGNPIDAVNFTNRVWYPLLRYLGLKKRQPYQMRHTAATLMLAAGENPEWVAHMLGHTTTEMLFRVYSRYVPNVTRNDGNAFKKLLALNLDSGMPELGDASTAAVPAAGTSGEGDAPSPSGGLEGVLSALSHEQKVALLAALSTQLIDVSASASPATQSDQPTNLAKKG